jgi:hypothetical protein
VIRVTAESKRVVSADDVNDLSTFDRITLEAVDEGARIVIVYCEDETGNQFSYLGPMSSLERIAPGGPFRPERHGRLFPLYRAGWPSRDSAPDPATGAFAFLRERSQPRPAPRAAP